MNVFIAVIVLFDYYLNYTCKFAMIVDNTSK